MTDPNTLSIGHAPPGHHDGHARATPPRQAADKATELRLFPVTLASIYVLIAGVSCAFEFRQIGLMYVGEIMLALSLLVTVPMCSAALRKSPAFFTLMGFLGAMALGYAMSDMISATPPDRLLRGWARIAFVFLDFLAMSLIFLHAPRLFVWFCGGFGLGRFLTANTQVSRFSSAEVDYITRWKYHYGAGSMFLSGCAPMLLPKAACSLGIAVLGIMVVFLGARALGAAIFLAGVLTFFKSRRGGEGLLSFGRTVLVLGIAAGGLGIVYTMAYESILEKRHGAVSDEGRLSGVYLAAQTIAKSPVIGYGSWKFAQREGDLLKGSAAGKMGVGGHSYVLQSWLEGGILAGAFFLYLFYKSARSLYIVLAVTPYSPLLSLYVFVLIKGMWDILQSPFGGDHRMDIALNMAVICMIDRDMREQRTMAVAA